MIKDSNQEVFFSLIRAGIGHHIGLIPVNIDWPAIQDFANEQGLAAIVIDGVDMLPEDKRPPKEMLLEWIGEVLQDYEYRYNVYCRAIADLASFYNSHGYKMMVLKGYGCGLNWPHPENRPCGDIDIWLFGQQKEADSALIKEKGITIDSSQHHHTVFLWRDFMVENHYDFINVHHHKSNVELEMILKKLGTDDSFFVEVCGEKVFIPSPNLHALYLLRHSMSHFASTGLNIRQLLDWAFLVKSYYKEIDWSWLVNELKRFGMKELFDIFNAICVEDFGFPSSIFPYVQFNPLIKDRVLNDILTPEFEGKTPKSFLKRIVFKICRWRANGWKHRLCYKESMLSAFWSGVKNHFIKPTSI
jgi:hypothetical protein